MFACPACCPRSSVSVSPSSVIFFVYSFEWMYFTFSTFCAIFPVWPSYIFTLSLSMAGNSNFLKCHCIVSGVVGLYPIRYVYVYVSSNHVQMVNIHLFEIFPLLFNKLIEKFHPCLKFFSIYLYLFWRRRIFTLSSK